MSHQEHTPERPETLVERLEALSAKWRDAAVWEYDDMGNTQSAYTFDQCADELDAVLSSLASSGAAPPKCRDCGGESVWISPSWVTCPSCVARSRDELFHALKVGSHGRAMERIAELTSASSGAAPQELDAILREMNKAAAKFPTWPVRGTDAAAIVAEECGELQQAVLQATYEGGTPDAVRKEAIQTAAMAIQFLLNLPDTRFDAGEQKPKRLIAAPPERPTPAAPRQCAEGHRAPVPMCGACYVYDWSKPAAPRGEE